MYDIPPEAFDTTPEIEKLASDYPAERARARKAGLHLSVKEFKHPLPSDSENAAPLYNRLVAQKRTKEEDSLADFPGQNPVTSSRIEEANRLLARCDTTLRLVHTAISRPRCVFNWDWNSERPANIRMPEFGETRRCARLLGAESYLLAYKGNGTGAIQNQVGGFQIARHAFAAPILLGWLTGIAIEAITLAGMRRILLSRPDAATAHAITSVIGSNWKTLSLAAAMTGETAFGQSILDRGRTIGFLPFFVELNNDVGGFTDDADAKGRERETKQAWDKLTQKRGRAAVQAQSKMLFDAWGALMLRQMRKLHAAADLPYRQANPIFQAAQKEMEPPSKPDKRTVVLMVPSVIMPVFTNTIQQKARVEAQAATLRAGAAVLAYRAANNGRLPDVLPAPSTDPFTGRPLGYRKEPGAKGTGFVIYSVGAEGTFDGGRPGLPIPAPKGNLVFRFAP